MRTKIQILIQILLMALILIGCYRLTPAEKVFATILNVSHLIVLASSFDMKYKNAVFATAVLNAIVIFVSIFLG